MAHVIHLNDLNSDLVVHHVVISMVRIENDARSLNLVKALLQRGDKVALIGLFSENVKDLFSNETNIWLLYADDLSKKRAYQLWIGFHKALWKVFFKVKSSYWWASDVYVLPITFLMSKIHGGFTFYDSREIYSGLGENFGKPLKDRFLTYVEQFFIREVDMVYTSGYLDSRYIRDLYQIPEPQVILNVPELKELNKQDIIREKFSIPKDSKIAIYQGLIGPGRGLKQILQALKYVPQIHLCIVGDGIWLNELQQLVIDNKLEKRVHFTGWVSYESLLSWTCSADIGLVVIERYSKSLELALPNKLFEYAMAKIPVIATDLPQIKPIVDKNQSGVLISSKIVVEELVQAFLKLLDTENYQYYRVGSELVREQFNWGHETKKIHQMIDDVK